MSQSELFAPEAGARQDLAPGAFLLPGYALDEAEGLLTAAEAVYAAAPPRRWLTPGGRRMAVAMSNCGELGWISDEHGYRYGALDPDSGHPWPAMDPRLRGLAGRAAAACGFADFRPDACLLNRYEPGTRLSLHQDKDELDYGQPIVSVSLGLPAIFLFGGLRRADACLRLALRHGDVLVWGGPARLRYHGVAPLAAGAHERLGALRLNLTFRKAG
ncbi:DNA oxidative demethylase AlkB [Roseateles sp. DAIF2]|uniref:DNA oxidative demethylase AlkB n=1 Tax=Roseateles sp. DAIF2 TaxID=2714952 RepID=UPI0018A2D393|nr:DNA oxidative demethylase AlkB [Roseateles sp. DAIF2]QPF71805.1 DNA oxidative demethylase AlkB [Roseateles sp. DAIF2]